MSSQVQDNRSWGEVIVSNSAIDFIRKAINFNLFGNKEPKDIWYSILTGELTTSDMDSLISHIFSNHIKVLKGMLVSLYT